MAASAAAVVEDFVLEVAVVVDDPRVARRAVVA
jgi:hypothetical protein